MRIHSLLQLLGATALLATLVAGCTAVAETPAQAESTTPRVFFTSPQDGATVSSPVQVTMAAENFVVEPASDAVVEGHGHLHIMVDTGCIEPGQGIPKDETHLHYGQGQLEAALDLTPGEHTLCLQAADGLHVALAGEGMTQMIRVTVE
jgi:hypothetical protein